MKLVVVAVAPVPVGHRVRVGWYRRVEPGLAGQTRVEERPHQPRITDLDTGVVYDTDWAFGHGGRSAPDSPQAVEEEPLEGYEIAREIEATVRACRVVTVRTGRVLDVQTHLVLDP